MILKLRRQSVSSSAFISWIAVNVFGVALHPSLLGVLGDDLLDPAAA